MTTAGSPLPLGGLSLINSARDQFLAQCFLTSATLASFAARIDLRHELARPE